MSNNQETNSVPIIVIEEEPIEEPKLVATEETVQEPKRADPQDSFADFTRPLSEEDKKFKAKFIIEEQKHTSVQIAKAIKDNYNNKLYQDPTNPALIRIARYANYQYRKTVISDADKIPAWTREPWTLYISNGTLYIGSTWGPLVPKYQALAIGDSRTGRLKTKK